MDLKAMKKREKLFWIQAAILLVLIVTVSLTFLTYNEMHIGKGIKVFFAPFLSVVPLIFLLTVIKDWVRKFSEDDYSQKEIALYSLIAVITAVVFVIMVKILSTITTTEILIAVIIAIISLLSFVSLKVRDILGMSILTGVSEGIIIFMVFMY
jgi:hypothetical protein